MKYIKKFENNKDNVDKYWKVSTDPDMYKKSLDYLGVPPTKGIYHLDLSHHGKHVFISSNYGWSTLSSDEWYKQRGYKYLGEIDDDVLNANKYNL